MMDALLGPEWLDQWVQDLQEGRSLQPDPADIILGVPTAAHSDPQVRVRSPQQRFHGLIWGSTGSGKSKLLESILLQYLDKGRGVGLIDPHADLAQASLTYLTAAGFFTRPTAYEELVYIDFSKDSFVPLNVLASRGDPHTIAANTLDALTRTWPELDRAPLFRSLFLSSCLTLIANGLPLTSVFRLLLDPDFRSRCLARVDDPLVAATFAHYDNLGRGQTSQAGSTLRRAFLLCFNPISRGCLGQTDNVLDLRALMDAGRSLLVNLGSIPDPVTRRLMGSLLLVQAEQAALSRADMAPEARRPWTLLLDEWPTFAAGGATLEHILSETRKYGLYLYLAAQTLSQVGGKSLGGALENCRLTVTFRLGRDSAEIQARHIGRMKRDGEGTPSVSAQREDWVEKLMDLPPRHAYAAIENKPPIAMKALEVAAPDVPAERVGAVVEAYRARYQRPDPGQLDWAQGEEKHLQSATESGVIEQIFESDPEDAYELIHPDLAGVIRERS